MKFFSRREGGDVRDLVFLLTSTLFLYFHGLGRLPLIDPDEGRYAEIPREMLERGDFITPTLNYVKYFEKPPLHYWLTALSLKLFGENEFAARFPGVLCAVLTVLLTWWVGRAIFGRRAGLVAACLLATAGGFQVQARINFTDMTLTFCLSAACAFFLLAAREGATRKRLHYHLFFLFMALAMLAKGLIGVVLPGAIILLYLALTGRWRVLREIPFLTGGALFAAICAPWFILVSLRNPEFPHFFFIREHVERFLTKVHHRYQPPWFFIPILAATLLPWTTFLPAALLKGWRERLRGDNLFLLLWGGVIFAFFSASSSKLVPYILPVFPPIALLIGRWFEETPQRSVRWHAALTALLLMLLGGAAVAYPHVSGRGEIGVVDAALVGALLIGEGVVAGIGGWSGRALPLFGSLAAAAAIFAVCAPPLVYNKIADRNSAKELALSFRDKAPAEARIACYSGYLQGIPFYTHKRVILVGGREELEFGASQGDQSAWFMEREPFYELWDGPGAVFATVSRRDLPAFREKVRHRPEVVAVAGDTLLLSNQPPLK